jgi:L-iditol 2-dehydrogenase
MLEPVNTVLKAVRRLNLLPGDAVLVAGQGPIGLMFTKILQLRGIRVLATDLLPSRLKLAGKFGAKWISLASRSRRKEAGLVTSPPTIPALDAAVIAVPSDDAVLQSLRLVRGGGKVLLFAHTKRNKSEIRNRKSENSPPAVSAFHLDLASICLDEKDLIGSYSSDFTLQAEVARLVFSRRLDVRQLISHTFPLDQTAAAVALAARPAEDSLKILVSPQNSTTDEHRFTRMFSSQVKV